MGQVVHAIRLHGWPDDTDLSEILERILDDADAAKTFAPSPVWVKDGKETPITDPSAALKPYRAAIKETVAPPRDASPHRLRCDVGRLRCIDDERAERVVFTFAWRDATTKKDLLLVRMESLPPK